MRRMAEGGATAQAIMAAFDRPKTTVRRHCGDALPEPRRGRARLLGLLALAEASRRSRGVLAHDLGFANAASLGVVLSRARQARRRVIAEGGQPCL